jgi:hypothetical protein
VPQPTTLPRTAKRDTEKKGRNKEIYERINEDKEGKRGETIHWTTPYTPGIQTVENPCGTVWKGPNATL